MSSIPLAWLKNCENQKEKDDLIYLLRNNVILFTNLRRILRDRYEEFERGESKLEDFSDGDWAMKQAWRNGYKASLLSLKELTDFIEGNKK